jgi:hypothetical protein
MKKFSDILPTLEAIDHVARIELFDDDGDPAGVIENRPGSQGSVRVYHHLWKKCGSISCDAARQGLKLYAEHTEDAEHYPGKHPNIDRLFNILEDTKPLSVKIVEI